MIEVRNEGRCPQAVAVEQRLEPLLPAALVSAAAPLNDVAVVDERGDGSLTLSLSRPDGTLLGRRRLPRAATCADQADTVAVTLAVWEAEIHPELALRLDRLPATGRSAPPAPRALPAPSLASVEAPRAAPAPPAAAIAAPAPITATPAAIPWHFGLGVALGAGAAPTSPGPFAPTARVDLDLRAR